MEDVFRGKACLEFHCQDSAAAHNCSLLTIVLFCSFLHYQKELRTKPDVWKYVKEMPLYLHLPDYDSVVVHAGAQHSWLTSVPCSS